MNCWCCCSVPPQVDPSATPRPCWPRPASTPGGTGRRSPTSSTSTPGPWINTAPSSTPSTSPSPSTSTCCFKPRPGAITSPHHYHHHHHHHHRHHHLHHIPFLLIHSFTFINFHDLELFDMNFI
ncbi:unnamed protein product [Meganyctiphanes norvegica]|uniref:Uncharacterized protein n=1 Tax=Meganyctiphanes norvegica TaxID=48144 RepID=A0AAV2R0Q6_MEGNR